MAQEGTLTLSAVAYFDANAVSVDAAHRAAYRMCDRLAVEVRSTDGELRCEIWAIDGADPAPSDVAHFRVEVTDHALREKIRRQTEGIRNVVLSLAFSHASLVEDP